MTVLERVWEQAFVDLDVSRPPPCAFDELVARYSEPHRAYHTLQHLDECFAGFAEIRALLKAPGEVALALLYHDAVYDTHASNNEERSADLALDMLGEYCATDGDQDDRIRRLILTTRHDAKPEWRDAGYLVDIDLSILGASSVRFDEYEMQVRHEYAWVGEAEFRNGRAAVLKQFLDRPAIYTTQHFRDRLEQAARFNLGRSLSRLG